MAENDLLKRLLDAGMTFTALTQARAEELVRDLVRTGAVQAEQAQASVDELVERSRRNRERLVGAVRAEIDDQLAKLDLATRDDLDRMVQRFADVAASLIAQVSPDRGADRPSPSSGPTASPSDRRPPGPATSPPKKSAPAKQTPGKKTPSKATGSAPASSGVASSAVKSTPAKSSSAKKSSAKKSPSAAKKSPPRKSSAKKSSAKKSPAKKSSARKSSASKTSAKKTATKKATGDRSPSSDR